MSYSVTKNRFECYFYVLAYSIVLYVLYVLYVLFLYALFLLARSRSPVDRYEILLHINMDISVYLVSTFNLSKRMTL